jgi:hypothetical protein
MSGSAVGSLWGQGLYFARDSQYSKGFAGRNKDGSLELLLCLVVTGLSTLGDGAFKKLPSFHGSTSYHSAVDCLSNPEIFVVQKHSAAYPAYVVTFKES